MGLRPLRFVHRTSDSTLRGVFMEDSAAVVGLLLAADGIALHQVTGHAIFDALGSIAVGLLLGFVAIFLMRRNMDYLLGQEISPPARGTRPRDAEGPSGGQSGQLSSRRVRRPAALVHRRRRRPDR